MPIEWSQLVKLWLAYKMKKQKSVQINSIEQLRTTLKKNGDFKDFAIVLGGGGMFSRKEIALTETPTGKERFHVHNCIDDSMQLLSEKQMMNKDWTNIGDAILKGAFYQIIY